MDEPSCQGTHNGCQLSDLFHMLGKAHVMDILYVAISSEGPVRFNEIESRVKLSPNTLSARLKMLTEAGLLARTAYNEIPPRVDYEATGKARRLRGVFKALHEWSAENTLTADVTA